MNKVFSSINNVGTILEDAVGGDFHISESGVGTFQSLVVSNGVNMNSSKITNLGTPTSNSDGATKIYVDNKTITLTGDVTGSGTGSFAATIAGGAVSLAKMSNLDANSLIGNNTGSAATPAALTVAQVKNLLSLNNVENSALSTFAGSSNITTVGAVSSGSLASGFGAVNCSELATDTIKVKTSNANLVLNPIGGGFIDMSFKPLINVGAPQAGNHAVNRFYVEDLTTMSNLTSVGELSSGSIANGFGTINSGAITSDSITAKTTNLNLSLSGNGNAGVMTNSHHIISNNSGDSILYMGGTGANQLRYIRYENAGVYRVSTGLSFATHYFIFDPIGNRDMLQAKFNQTGNGSILLGAYTTTGTMSIGGSGAINVSSDRRLKTNEVLLDKTESLQKIMNLQPKKYEWLSELGKTKIGFIAQDVEDYIPEAIDGKRFEYELIYDNVSEGDPGTIRLGEDGNPVMDMSKPRYRGFDQGAILSTLVSAVQKLSEKVDNLTSRIEILEGA